MLRHSYLHDYFHLIWQILITDGTSVPAVVELVKTPWSYVLHVDLSHLWKAKLIIISNPYFDHFLWCESAFIKFKASSSPLWKRIPSCFPLYEACCGLPGDDTSRFTLSLLASISVLYAHNEKYIANCQCMQMALGHLPNSWLGLVNLITFNPSQSKWIKLERMSYWKHW